MTERPTEQTHPRLTALDAPASASNGQAPTPTAPAERPAYRPQSAPASDRPSLTERLQERLTSARQTERTAGSSTNDPEQATGRPGVQASAAAPEAPASAAQDRPVTPPAAYQPASEPVPGPAQKRPTRTQRAKRPPRRARLRLTRIDPWSVMKTAFLLSIALGVVTIVSVLMVWSVLGAAGVWDSINTTVRDIVGDQADSPFTIQNYLGTDRVIGFTMLVAVIDVVLLTAIATLAAFLYNMAAALLGGIELTLVEDER